MSEGDVLPVVQTHPRSDLPSSRHSKLNKDKTALPPGGVSGSGYDPVVFNSLILSALSVLSRDLDKIDHQVSPLSAEDPLDHRLWEFHERSLVVDGMTPDPVKRGINAGLVKCIDYSGCNGHQERSQRAKCIISRCHRSIK